ncbi:MAG: arylsulfatase [Acidobacteria bacterium]|nr:arylsulfatase [Acidobacteriota bacterium]
MLNRRSFLGCAAGAAFAQRRDTRPNIVLLFADDLGFSDIGPYGGEIATPNLDKLAAGGLRFTQFYNTARCCPSRAALMTGLYPHQAGIGHMMDDRKQPAYRGDLAAHTATIAEVLRGAGYQTFMAGKWHVTPVNGSKHNWPLQRGFQRYYGTIHGAGSFFDPVSLTRDNEPVRAEGKDYYYTTALGEEASKFIEAGAGKPFFLYTAFTAPHWPLHALAEDIAAYKDRYRAGWDKLREERHARQIKAGLVRKEWGITSRDKDVPAWEQAEEREWQIQRMAVYAAQVTSLDRAIGRIVDTLRRTGELDNTLILFFADNGGCAEHLGPNAKALHIPVSTPDGRPVRQGNRPNVPPGPDDTYQSYGIGWANASNTPFRLYKHWVHEGGISSPLIAHWPRAVRARGGISEQVGHLVDIMPTCVDAAGAKYPKEKNGQAVPTMEGSSLLPALRGGRPQDRTLYWEHEGNRAVRRGRWKLVSRWKEPWELFDMEADRTERNNLAAARPELVRELSELWDAWAMRCKVLPWDQVSGPSAG